MTAETEAAEMLVRIAGSTINELIRITGTGARLAGRGSAQLIGYLWALKTNGSPKEIARNPGGMAIVTIPADKLDDFAAAGKAFPYFRFFTIDDPDYEDGYIDVCLKAEDVATAKRICEKIGITTAEETQTFSQLSPDEIGVSNAADFAEAAEAMKPYVLASSAAAFNRDTDKDLSRSEPFYICARTNPENYVRIMPEKAEFEGNEYTKSKYTCYRAGKQVAVYSDERAPGVEKGSWREMRESIMKSANLPENDLVYFKNEAVFNRYRALKDGTASQIVEVDADKLNDTAMKPFLSELKARIELAEVKKADPSLTPAKEAAGGNRPSQSESISNDKKIQSSPETTTSRTESFYDVRDEYKKSGVATSVHEQFERLAEHDFKVYSTDGPYGFFAEQYNKDMPKEGSMFYIVSVENPDNYIRCFARPDKDGGTNIIVNATENEFSYNGPVAEAKDAIGIEFDGGSVLFTDEAAFLGYKELYGREIFEYQGKHFVPLHASGSAETSLSATEEYSKSVEVLPDKELGFDGYADADFYDAATQEANLFYCKENGKTYMPFDDGLHEYIPGNVKEKDAEKTAEPGGIRAFIEKFKAEHKGERSEAKTVELAKGDTLT